MKRYDLSLGTDTGPDLLPDDNGEWVRWEDVQAVIEATTAIRVVWNELDLTTAKPKAIEWARRMANALNELQAALGDPAPLVRRAAVPVNAQPTLEGVEPVSEADNQWFGDMMMLQVLADSENVNEQEREVLTRWMAASRRPGQVKCDGNHGGPACADSECWNDSPPDGVEGRKP